MKLYRYSTNLFDSENINVYHASDNVCVYLHEYESIRQTKCGAWILLSGDKKKFVNLDAIKQFASKTKEDAKYGFLRRKERQIKILSSQLGNAKESILAVGTEELDYSAYMTFDDIPEFLCV